MKAKQIIAVLIFYLPFLILPVGTSFFEIPKVVIAEAGIELLLLLTLLDGKLKLLFNLRFLPLYLLFLLSLFIFLINPASTLFFGNIFRLQGVFLLWHLLLLAILSSKTDIFNRSGFFYFLLISASLVLALVGFILGITSEGRAVGSLGEPNSLSAIAIFFFTLVYFKNNYKFWIVGAIICLELILLSGSRSGLFAFMTVIIFIGLSHNLLLEVKKASIVGILLIIISLIFPFVEGGGWFENRAEIWQTAVFAGMKSPVFGNGFGNVQSSLATAAKELNNNVQYQVVDSSHNIFLDFWVQGGILGLFLFLSIIIMAFINFLRSDSRIMIALLLGLLYSLSFNPLSVSVLLIFWYVLGQGFFKTSES